MYTGMGIVRGIPGPVFSIASFAGGMALKDKGPTWQVLGCLIGSIGIFLPSALLVLFFYPIWNNLKKYAAVYRSLEGINAAVMGIMIGSTFYIMKDISWMEPRWMGLMNLMVVLSTVLFLLFSRIPAPILVIAYVLLGIFF
jgi:chromate transporter